MIEPQIMHQETAKILWNEAAGPSVHRIGLECGTDYETAGPGQFVTIRLPEELTPLLRRPFSIHRLIREESRVSGIEILYKAVGGFTRKLAQITAGTRIDLLGPLGNGFTVAHDYKSAALVAGGIGVAPMVFLAEKLIKSGIHAENSVVCLGGRSADDILCAADFRSLSLETRLASEDGSIGEKALVTQILENWLKKHQPDIIYACGPMPMLEAVAAMAAKDAITCEVSIETIMACGVGACLGCAVKDTEHKAGYGHVCIDGPVFKSDRVLSGVGYKV